MHERSSFPSSGADVDSRSPPLVDYHAEIPDARTHRSLAAFASSSLLGLLEAMGKCSIAAVKKFSWRESFWTSCEVVVRLSELTDLVVRAGVAA